MRYTEIIESVMAELAVVPQPENVSREIGSAGQAVSASMNDMLPHRGISDRNKPQAYAEIFAKSAGTSHNDNFEREPAPVPKTIKQRRNNDAGIKKLTAVPKAGNARALLHTDFAGKRPNTKSVIPRRTAATNGNQSR